MKDAKLFKKHNNNESTFLQFVQGKTTVMDCNYLWSNTG